MHKPYLHLLYFHYNMNAQLNNSGYIYLLTGADVQLFSVPLL